MAELFGPGLRGSPDSGPVGPLMAKIRPEVTFMQEVGETRSCDRLTTRWRRVDGANRVFVPPWNPIFPNRWGAASGLRFEDRALDSGRHPSFTHDRDATRQAPGGGNPSPTAPLPASGLTGARRRIRWDSGLPTKWSHPSCGLSVWIRCPGHAGTFRPSPLGNGKDPPFSLCGPDRKGLLGRTPLERLEWTDDAFHLRWARIPGHHCRIHGG